MKRTNNQNYDDIVCGSVENKELDHPEIWLQEAGFREMEKIREEQGGGITCKNFLSKVCLYLNNHPGILKNIVEHKSTHEHGFMPDFLTENEEWQKLIEKANSLINPSYKINENWLFWSIFYNLKYISDDMWRYILRYEILPNIEVSFSEVIDCIREIDTDYETYILVKVSEGEIRQFPCEIDKHEVIFVLNNINSRLPIKKEHYTSVIIDILRQQKIHSCKIIFSDTLGELFIKKTK